MSSRTKSSSEGRYRSYLKAELEAAAMYGAMAEVEKDSSRAEIFEKLAQAEMRHAARWAQKLEIDASTLVPQRPDSRIRLYKLVARFMGTNRLIPWLLKGEAKDIEAYAADPEAQDILLDERKHARTLRELAQGSDPLAWVRAEGQNTFSAGGGFRAAVLGINDGLVSNFSLVMGVAGGTSNSDIVLLAGVAGLLAGAFSMAAGEYVSMRSQRDLYEHQISLEEAELREWPEEEEEELVLIYQAKGLSREEAELIASRIMSRPQVALDTMAREELGLDPSQLGSPWGAAGSSFAAFVAGAIVPILPYVFDAGGSAFSLSAILSVAALLGVGGLLAAITGRSVSWGALRMLLAGGAAASVTFGVGSLLGNTIIG